ncbi:MAG TPA: UvrD-helicase domain-containing protein, partial [Candidatus Mediterraneibacter norfolkensis]|nr:UvrD-helicase domain-containing protein [Candidatus Mediterraneibacter norfolkensis]
MYIADLHIHSRYSRATSKDCTPEHLDLWARRKGIHIVGTGDFTHPAWREELTEKLEPAEEGLYVLKEEYRIKDSEVPGEMTPRFVITGEISSIYKKNGKVRKVHSLILLPGLEDAEKISAKLEQIGNIHSDGRPILGLDCHDLLEIILELCPSAVYVPAHIWTPHFSLFGAFSGFDTVKECFEDLTPYIHAMETGLSSDPPMNWRVSALDRFQLISNSDAHSPAKLGREANLFDIPMSYDALADAIQTGKGLDGTIEFFPEEGKYHMDGHRKCNLCLTPSETLKYNGKCPVCGRKITIGVSHRVEELADREEGYVRENAKRFESLVPLPEVIGASIGASSTSKKVDREYRRLLAELGPEFEILRNLPLEEIRRAAGTRIAEGIERLRNGQVERIPGFDGEYGVIRLFSAEELNNTEGQMNFFDMLGVPETETIPSNREKDPDRDRTGKTKASLEAAQEIPEDAPTLKPAAPVLNPEQAYAVRCTSPRIAVKAGPGTGKTKTLVSRLRYLLEYRKVKPSDITAVTFTNQAAAEMRERIERETGKKQTARAMQIGTFHAICLDFLKEQGENPVLMTNEEQRRLAEETVVESGIPINAKRFLEMVSRCKSKTEAERSEIDEMLSEEQIPEKEWQTAWDLYEKKKEEKNLWDFDDLLLRTVRRIENGETASGWEKRFRYLLVDEFQDIDPVQFRLVKLWSSAGRELFVIGDPDQSIYGFRGADAKCFDKLKKEYNDLETVTLRENYRSSPQILNAATSVISQEERRSGEVPGENLLEESPCRGSGRQVLHPNCPDNVLVRLVHAGSPMGEAVFIAKEINRLVGGIGMLEAHENAWERGECRVRGFDEIAVLCRTHHQAELVEKCLKKESLPYIVAGREDFLQESTVQDSLCFFRYLEDPEDIEAMKSAAEQLWKLEWNEMTEEVIRSAAEKFRPLYQKKKPQKFIEQWMEEMGLAKDLAMQKLLQMTVFYKNMPEFMNAISLGVESDLRRCGTKKYTADAVTIMTLHGSKGLEFPVVFIYGADQGSIPLESEKHLCDREEERRLFYVGMTRAKEELLLTTSGEASEFLKSLPDGLMEEENV